MNKKMIVYFLTLMILASTAPNVFAQNQNQRLVQMGLENLSHEKYSDAFHDFLTAAEAGNADGQYYAGYCYLTAQGVTHNDSVAVKWFQKAADQGNAKAERSMADCYENGWGVSADPSLANQWRQKAAQPNGTSVQSALQTSSYPPASSNPESGGDEASNWVKKADAAVHRRKYSEAYQWYKKAAEAGNLDGECGLGDCYLGNMGVPFDLAQAINWYQKAADAGHARAQREVGYMYFQGQGVKADHVEAVKWFQKAAAQGEKDAENGLAMAYEGGDGIEKDLEKAKFWYEKAAAQGIPGAKYGLARLNKLQQ